MEVIHKPNAFNNRIITDAWIWLRFGFDRLMYFFSACHVIKSEWDWYSLYYLDQYPDDQEDWRKIWGSKSGVVTEENYEEIVAYRIVYENSIPYIEVCKYVRTKGTFVAKFTKRAKIPKYGSVTISTPVRLRYLLPVTPWAGGDKLNDDHYSFKVKIITVFNIKKFLRKITKR